MVAAFVLAIGLLGLAALQARSLQFNQSAYQRSHATFLAYDIIDRMRANLAQARLGSYAIDLNDAPPGSVDCQTTTACAATDMATFDLSQWKCSLGKWDDNNICSGTHNIEGALLEGDGSVEMDGTTVTVTIRWIDDRTKETDEDGYYSTFTTSTTL